VLPVVFGTWLVYAVAYGASPLFALLLNVCGALSHDGFRQRSHYFTDIHLALKNNDVDKARDILSAWRQVDCAGLEREAITRLAIEEALVSSHRYVFAVIFWFVLLPGPAGAILYRLSMFLNDRWGERTSPELERFSRFARRAFAALDWLPCASPPPPSPWWATSRMRCTAGAPRPQIGRIPRSESSLRAQPERSG